MDKETKVPTLSKTAVSTRTYHFLDWVDGKHVDEQVKAVDRKEAIGIMRDKYPNHEFTYVCELS